MGRRSGATLLVSAVLLLGGVSALAATQRRVAGIITEVEQQSLTIAPERGARPVKGRLETRTAVMVDGRAAKVGDLKVTYDAKAELGLDDVWISVRAVTQ
jgi:hypothetical protein